MNEYTDVMELSDAADDASSDMFVLDRLQAVDADELSAPALEMVGIILKSVTDRLGMPARQVALESDAMKDDIAAKQNTIWATIKKFFVEFYQKVVKYIKSFFDRSKEIEDKIDTLEKILAAPKPVATEAASDFTLRDSVISHLALGGKVSFKGTDILVANSLTVLKDCVNLTLFLKHTIESLIEAANSSFDALADVVLTADEVWPTKGWHDKLPMANGCVYATKGPKSGIYVALQKVDSKTAIPEPMSLPEAVRLLANVKVLNEASLKYMRKYESESKAINKDILTLLDLCSNLTKSLTDQSKIKILNDTKRLVMELKSIDMFCGVQVNNSVSGLIFNALNYINESHKYS